MYRPASRITMRGGFQGQSHESILSTPGTQAVPGYVFFGADGCRHELQYVPNAFGADEKLSRNRKQSGRSGRWEANIGQF
jgi:hypothetical protein